MVLRSLCVLSHVVHYQYKGRLYAYGPYAREIDVWADLFPEIVIAAPCRFTAPPGDCLPLGGSNIRIAQLRETGGGTWKEKVTQLLALPAIVFGLSRAMRQADAIHVRCPGNIGLLGAILGPLFCRYRVAKYAGQWTGYEGEPVTVRLQREILSSRWWNAPVTVYGECGGRSANVEPFFTSVLTSEQVDRARSAARHNSHVGPLRVLYVGRLSPAKHVDHVLVALDRLKHDEIPFTCDIVGDGTERAALERLAADLELQECVSFHGAVTFEDVLAFYERADVLVLVSETEGWPKAIAEAMAFGLVCIGSDRGLLPQMLADGRGHVVPPGDPEVLYLVLRNVAVSPCDYGTMRRRAAEWGQRYSLEELRAALRDLLANRWNVSIGSAASERQSPSVSS